MAVIGRQKVHVRVSVGQKCKHAVELIMHPQTNMYAKKKTNMYAEIKNPIWKP